MSVDQPSIDWARSADLVAVMLGRTKAPPRRRWGSAFHVAGAVGAGGVA